MAIFEELLEAMNQAYELGLVLKLLPHEVDAIEKLTQTHGSFSCK